MILDEDVDNPETDLLDLMIFGGEELLGDEVIDLYFFVDGHEVRGTEGTKADQSSSTLGHHYLYYSLTVC